MVAAVRQGASMRSVARQFRVSLLTVQRWVQRAQDKRLDRVDFRDQPSGPRLAPRRTPPDMEELVLSVREQLRQFSDLGEFGAGAIHRELLSRAVLSPPTAQHKVPSVPTINRILERRGVFDAHRRVRRPSPPAGWYLPDVAQEQAELDQFDVVEGLVIKGGPQVEVLTAVSLHGALIGAWPTQGVKAKSVCSAMVEHWQQVGLPAYAQFDNDTRFQGPHQYPDVVGSVMRLCLSLGVVPVFAPARESGFQASIESLNGRWQAKVWARFEHESLCALQERSARYVAASRARNAVRVEGAPARQPFPVGWKLNLQTHPADYGHARMIFLRRTTPSGEANLLGHTFSVDERWSHRLVRCEVDLEAEVIRFFALRRREPSNQPLLAQVP